MLHPSRCACLVLCLSFWSGCADDSRGESPPVAPLGSHEWDEQDAKLLLSVVLKGACGLLSSCDVWLPTALDLDANDGVSFSAAAHTRFTATRQQLIRSGQRERALALDEWLANAMSDLESVSSIGLSRSAVQAVLGGLMGPRAIVSATTAGDAAGRSAPADAFVRELYAQVRARSAARANAAGHVARNAFASNKGVTLGTATDAPGGGQLDTALDPTCENLGPDRLYCIYERDGYHEWAIPSDIRVPHDLHVAFAAAARRCEPCQDGAYATGTLRAIRNARGQVMTMCDTSRACDPNIDPRVPGCPCMN